MRKLIKEALKNTGSLSKDKLEEAKYWMSYLGHTYVCKSKVQEAVFDFLSQNNRVFVDDVEAFKNHILDGVKSINAKYPRNKPVLVHWYNGYMPKREDWTLDIPGICSFSIYEVLQERLTT